MTKMDPGDLGYRRCRYVRAYIGECGALLTGDDRFCTEHRSKRCSTPGCEGQAVRECSYAGQFVCGAPLCEQCEGYEDRAQPSGSWGFLNHSHRRRDGFPLSTMTAADIGVDDGKR